MSGLSQPVSSFHEESHSRGSQGLLVKVVIAVVVLSLHSWCLPRGPKKWYSRRLNSLGMWPTTLRDPSSTLITATANRSSGLSRSLSAWRFCPMWGIHERLYAWNPRMAEGKVNSLLSVIAGFTAFYYTSVSYNQSQRFCIQQRNHIHLEHDVITFSRVRSCRSRPQINKSRPRIRAALE